MPYADLEYVRRSIPIRNVAEQLGLRIVGNMVHCWRPDKHQHGDRTPSVGLLKRWNIARCFVCDTRALSPIDLVMSVLEVDFGPAMCWIRSRWDVPTTPKGSHIQHQQRWPERFRTGTREALLEVMIRSGIWACLTPAQHSILPVIDAFADPQTRTATISYRGIMRFSGVRSPSTVARALKRFRSLRILSVEAKANSDGFRDCNSYRLTLDDPEFLRLAERTYEARRKAIAQERKFREEARKQRQRSFTSNSLSNGCSAVEFDATASRSVTKTDV